MSGITAEQHSILRVTLGLDLLVPEHRNIYHPNADTDDCSVLVSKGMPRKWGSLEKGEPVIYRATTFGRKIANGKLIGEE